MSIPNGGPQVPDAALAEGWVKLRDDAGRKKEDSEESEGLLQRLEETESKARSEGKGLWKEGGAGTHWVETVHELPEPQKIVGDWKGRDLDGGFDVYSFSFFYFFTPLKLCC